MEISPELLLIVNAIIVTLVVFSLMRLRRGSTPPVRLRLGDTRKPPPAAPPVVGSRTEYRPRHSYKTITGTTLEDAPPLAPPGAREPSDATVATKDLNVHFNYNGHSWDAYEILGIPAGSSREAARRAHDELVRKVDEESQAFLAAALAAILQK